MQNFQDAAWQDGQLPLGSLPFCIGSKIPSIVLIAQEKERDHKLLLGKMIKQNIEIGTVIYDIADTNYAKNYRQKGIASLHSANSSDLRKGIAELLLGSLLNLMKSDIPSTTLIAQEKERDRRASARHIYPIEGVRTSHQINQAGTGIAELLLGSLLNGTRPISTMPMAI